MADEAAKTEEEIKSEETQTDEQKAADAEVLDAAIEKGEEETKGEVDQDLLDANKAFDDKMDGDDDDTAVTEEDTNEDAEEKTAEKDTGKEEADGKTAEDKEIDEAVKSIEEKAKVESLKSDDQKQAEAAAIKVAEEAKVVAEAKAKETGTYVSDLNPEEWDEEWIKTDTERGQKHLDEKKALQDQNAELQSMVQQQAQQRIGDWLDRQIDKLGEKFHEVLGEGEFEDLLPASVPYENRIKVGNRMGAIQQAYVDAKKEVPPRSKLFKRAVNDLFSEVKNKAKTEAKTVEKLAERKDQVLGKSSQKASKISAAAALEKSNAEFDRKMDGD